MTATDVHDAEAERPNSIQEAIELAKTIGYALVIALVLRVIFFQPFTIPSESMVPNLLKGDYIIVSKYSYGWSHHSIPGSPALFKGRLFGHAPKRGDIIVFKLPRDGRQDYIKRLIGLPGDRIQVRGGVIYLNSKPLPQDQLSNGFEEIAGFERPVYRYQETNPEGRKYIIHDYGPDGQLDNTPVYIVPEGHYFFMGDNRDNSLDSRVSQDVGVGFVPFENLVGKAEIILFSWRDASLFKPWTWVLNARPSRFLHILT